VSELNKRGFEVNFSNEVVKSALDFDFQEYVNDRMYARLHGERLGHIETVKVSTQVHYWYAGKQRDRYFLMKQKRTIENRLEALDART